MFFHKKIDVRTKHVCWSLLDLQKPPKISPRAWVLIDWIVFCSENVPENHQVLKSEVPGLQKSSPGLQKRYRKHQKDVLGSPIKRPIIQLIPSILRLAYYGPAECAKRLNKTACRMPASNRRDPRRGAAVTRRMGSSISENYFYVDWLIYKRK